jgi:DNA-binding LacI/PurR family transcriptional regulator
VDAPSRAGAKRRLAAGHAPAPPGRCGAHRGHELLRGRRYSAGRELLDRPDRPTAIFAGADIAAVGVLRAVYELGLRIPQDLSLAGYDNTTIAAIAPINLTSVDQAGP